MRLILHHHHLDIDRKAATRLPDDTVAFLCFEDFSVGPLGDWHDRALFEKRRAAFWRTTELLTLPDGKQMAYFVWHQSLPRIDLVEMVKSGVAVDDIPMPRELHDLIPEATRIEIWHDGTVRGHVFLWYMAAVLKDLSIDAKIISTCRFEDHLRTKRSGRFWSDMLTDAPDREIAALQWSDTDRSLALQYWTALTKLPEPVDLELMNGAEPTVKEAFDILAKRHLNGTSQLTNLQQRLLNAARSDWRKMARTIGDAMVAGIDENDPVGDFVLQAELHAMARMTPPLVDIEGEGAMRFCRVRLTSQGEAMKAY